MTIEVCRKNYTYDLVEDQMLDELIEREEIVAFRRSDGWAIIGEDRLRETYQKYSGPERRY